MNILEGVPLFLQRAGLILMAAAWLPLSFFGRAQERGLSLAGQIRNGIPGEAAYAVRAPVQAVQFHQLRLSGLGCWFSMVSGLDSIEPGFLLERTLPGSERIWLIPSAP